MVDDLASSRPAWLVEMVTPEAILFSSWRLIRPNGRAEKHVRGEVVIHDFLKIPGTDFDGFPLKHADGYGGSDGLY